MWVGDPIWLLSLMSTPDIARCFAEWYVPHQLAPAFFAWPEVEFTDEADSILADPEYLSAYAAGGHLAPHYGAPQVTRHHAFLRSKRAIHLVHYRNMRGVFPRFSLERISQVWEFGVGFGDLIALFRDLGYNGTYFAYDMFPVLLFAGYWLRYSALPAYFGAQLPTGPDSVRNRTVLESSTGTSFFDHVDRTQLRETLFVAFETFSEAFGVDTDRAWPLIKQCGFIIMNFEEDWGGRDNVPKVAALVRELEVTHNVLVWRKPTVEGALRLDRSGNFSIWVYLTAALKDLGELTCGPPSSCTKEGLHPAFHPAEERH